MGQAWARLPPQVGELLRCPLTRPINLLHELVASDSATLRRRAPVDPPKYVFIYSCLLLGCSLQVRKEKLGGQNFASIEYL